MTTLGADIHELLASNDRSGELEQFLMSQSKLPGPRANLTLAATFADCFERLDISDERWELLLDWLQIGADDAPIGNPREFLPFCAIQAVGACYARLDASRREIANTLLHEAANDQRWRMCEAVSMALQRIGEKHFDDLDRLTDRFVAGTLLEQRAIATAFAHPPILSTVNGVTLALQVLENIAKHVVVLNDVERKSEQFQILRKGLAFAPSVIVAASPDDGFALLECWLSTGDRDLRWIVRENLKKRRVSVAFPERVERLLLQMSA